MEAFVNEANKSGKVKLDFYHSETVYKAREALTAFEKGTIDIMINLTSNLGGTWPIMCGISLPFLAKDGPALADKLKMGTPLRQFIDEQLATKHGVYMLASGEAWLAQLWMARKPVSKPEDMKGLKIRGAGTTEGKVLVSLGASPVSITSGELYEAFQRGTIDGGIFMPGTVDARALHEVLKYCTLAGFTGYGQSMYLKKSKWEALPKDVRDILTQAAKKYEADLPKLIVKVHDGEYWPKIKQAGIKIIEPSPQELAALKAASKPAYDWFKELVGAELGGKFIELAAK